MAVTPLPTELLSAPKREPMQWLGPAAIALLCVALTLPYFGHLADYDEFYTLLAARGWLETGAPVIADGAYTRAISFSLLQAAFFAVFGESMLVARLPSLIAVMVCAAGLFLWVRRVANAKAATIAGIVFACAPLTIEMGQFSRFYALHGLAVGAMALLAYYACQSDGLRRVKLAVGAVVCLVLSLNLQSTTIIALCPLAIWVALTLVERAPTPRGRVLMGAGLVGGGLLAVLALWVSGIGALLWSDFQTTTFWGAVPERADNFRYYHQTLDQELGFLWSLFPLATAIAVLKIGRPMLFAAIFVAVTLGLQSMAGQKDERYVFYILPFIAVLLGVGLEPAISGFYEWLRRSVPLALGPRFSAAAHRNVAIALLAVSTLFAYFNNPPVADVLRMLAGARNVESLDHSWIADWPAEVATIDPLIEPPTVLVTSSGMKAIYYLGGYDFELNANVTDETDTRRDFGIDPRTGRQALAGSESVERLMRCYADIVFVIDESRWSRDTAVPIATSALIEARSERVPTRAGSELLVFRHRNGAASEAADFCKELRPGRRH